MGYPQIGTGTNGGGGVASTLFEKKDGTDAIFPNTGARDTYFQSNPDELAKLGNQPVGIGTADAITAGYVYDKSKTRWRAAAINFRGPKGIRGVPGQGIDPTTMSDGDLAKWDATSQKLVNSGVKSKSDGSISLEPASMHLGSHVFSSSAENITVTNKVTGLPYAPLWQEVGYGKKTGYIRAYQAEQSTVIQPLTDNDITNPVFSLPANANTTLFNAAIELSQDATNVEIRVLLGGEELWLARLGDLSAGKQKLTFTNPADFKQGNTYQIKILSSDGSDVVLKGGGPDNIPASSIHYADWSDLVIATQDWVENLKLVANLALSGSVLSVTKSDGTSENIDLQSGGGVVTKEFSTDNYQIKPSEVAGKLAFFVYNGSADVGLKLPDIDSLPVNGSTSIVIKNPTAYGVLANVFDDEKVYPALTSVMVPAQHSVMFVADLTTKLWHPIVLEGGGGTTGATYVTNISGNADGKTFTVYSSDGTNTTISLDSYASQSDVVALQAAISALRMQKFNRLKSFIYSGSAMPTYPQGNRGTYYLTFMSLATNLNITAPTTSKGLADGTVFFVDNNDSNYSVNVSPGKTGQTVDGKATNDVAPNTVAWYVKSGDNWNLLFSGYIPSTYKQLASELKSSFLSDDTFIRDIQIQGDDPNTILDCTSLEFPDAEVVPDPRDQQKGVVRFPALTLINPDGTKHKTSELKLVGMEVKDPGDGTPLKLLLLNDQGTPHPSSTSAYAFFSDSPTTPPKLEFRSLPVYRGGRVTVHKDVPEGQYVYILLPPGEGTDVDRVGELGGLPAYWSKNSKNYPVNGVPRIYTVLRSPYKFHENDVTLILYP